MPNTARAADLLRGLEMAHAYVGRICADLTAEEMDWHTPGCSETIRKQLAHLTQAARYFATRMGWRTPRKVRGESPLAEYQQLLEMYRAQMRSRKGRVSLRCPSPDDWRRGADCAGWVVLRMCFHALFHAPRISLLRRQFNPRWRPPRQGVFWTHVCNYLTTLVGG
jgi:hypothetical protein